MGHEFGKRRPFQRQRILFDLISSSIILLFSIHLIKVPLIFAFSKRTSSTFPDRFSKVFSSSYLKGDQHKGFSNQKIEPYFLINNNNENNQRWKWKDVDNSKNKHRTGKTSENVHESYSLKSWKEVGDNEALFKFGLLSDVQYGIYPEIGASRSGKPRYYKDALIKYENALLHWAKEDCLFGIHLGDFLDGHNAAANTSIAAMDHLIDVQNSLFPEKKIYHTIGNHCLYNFNRSQLRNKLNLQDCHGEAGVKDDVALQKSPLYYSRIFEYKDLRLKFIFLDGYALSLMATDEESIKEAKTILKANNKNVDNFNSPDGLEGLQRRFVAFGGGLGKAQLKWLDQELKNFNEKPKKDNLVEKCIICVHQGVHPESCIPMCLLWDYQDMIEILSRYSNSVTAVLSGHAHRGGYHFCEKTKIHYKVLEAVLETKPNNDAHAVVNVFKDRIHIKGRGSVSGGIFYL